MSKLTAKRLDVAIDRILIDAIEDVERFAAFSIALSAYVKTPCPAYVAGTEVTLLGFDFSGDTRLGVIAKCLAENGRIYRLAATSVELPGSGDGVDCLAAYRRWLRLTPYPRTYAPPGTEIEGQTTKLILLARLRNQTLRCRVLDNGEPLTLRLLYMPEVVPGEILTVSLRKSRRTPVNHYLTGKLILQSLDARALGLTPLALRPCGMWDPVKEYWGDEEPPYEKWVQAQIAWGPRPQYEMEQILPGNDLDVVDGDPIIRAVDLAHARQLKLANEILNELCLADLRCLDAHSHLGHFLFDRSPERAIRHYEVGVRIGELSLDEDFIGLLPWGWIDNRPFLRCLMGYALCLWRLNRFEEAHRELERMLWLNPTDNQGARFLLDDVAEHRPWKPDD